MKLLVLFISTCCLIGLSSCIEEEGGSGSGQEKPRDSKFLVPTKSQSSAQMKQHKAADKKLISSKEAKKDKGDGGGRQTSQAKEDPFGGQ